LHEFGVAIEAAVFVDGHGLAGPALSRVRAPTVIRHAAGNLPATVYFA
jgi:hypothetical protein